MKILIIEDEEIQIRIMDKIVSRFPKVETIRARDAFDGYAALRAIPDIDLVLTDHQMPYSNGINLVSKIKATPEFKNMKVVAISGEDNQNEYEAVGVDGYLDKPVSIESMYSILEKIIGK